MNAKKTLEIIDKVRNGWYDPPKTYHQKKSKFEKQSYSYSALNEIKFYIMEHENKDPILLLEEFRYQMDRFVYCSETSEAQFMFSIYYEVATDILDVLLGMD